MLRRIVPMVLAALALLLPLSAAAYDTKARAAYVYDLTTDTVLLEKNADEPLPPASMSKLMTVNMLFEALQDGRVSMDTRFKVSARAMAMGGSTMFLNDRDKPTVEQLIQGMIINSGNDACVVVAENLAGSEEAFAEHMNERAKALGLTNSHFANASGWPDPGQRMSVRDLGILATRLITQFPEYYKYFSMESFEFDGRAPANADNRNPLLHLGIGADGMKTGHTAEAGYGLVGSAVQSGRRVVVVVTGLDSMQARADEGEALINWAFRQFIQKTVVTKGQAVASAPVFLGTAPDVPLVAAADVSLLIPASQRDAVSARVEYSGPLRAPVAEGTEIGRMTISLEGLPDHVVPLVAGASVAKGGFLPHLKTAWTELWRTYVGGEPAAAK
jgi:D-alanyl-D-alanine carboxypeptidase (penicillin-binding protein 5/6)